MRPGAGPPLGRRPPVGCLLVNLGTPDAPTPIAVRRYLREFLSDPRVVEVPRVLWAFVLNAIVLPLRSRASARAYAKVWTEEGSPLAVHTRAAARALARRLGPGFQVVVGMRYGHPSLRESVDELVAIGCESVVALPLFPQYSNSTTGSVQAELARVLGRHRAQPALLLVPPYYDHPAYLDAVAARARSTPGVATAEHWVFSFHGLPEAYVRRGDPYLAQCERTAWALAERLGLERTHWDLAFQSRFGGEPWLGPYVDELVPGLAHRARRVAVVLPGFAADCLETLEEIGLRLAAAFRAAGGEELVVVPALNDSPAWVDALEALVRERAASAPALPGERATSEAEAARPARRGGGARAL